MFKFNRSAVAASVVVSFATMLGGCVGTADDEGVSAPSEEAVASDAEALGNLQGKALVAKGSFSCDFGLSNAVPINEVPPVIERDRMIMAARPGLEFKQLPIAFDNAGNVFSGGRYLFDTYKHAQEYRDWVETGFYLDGVEFLQRPIFIAPECHAWKVIGAHEFAPKETSQNVMRTERWSTPPGDFEGLLTAVWPELLLRAKQRGLSAVWLTYDKPEHLVQIVYFAPGSDPRPLDAPDFAAYGALAGAPSMGPQVTPPLWSKTFDRTEFVLTVWYPALPGDQGQPSLWPNSPPFPAPFCGDGLCEPSRGETSLACAADCP